MNIAFPLFCLLLVSIVGCGSEFDDRRMNTIKVIDGQSKSDPMNAASLKQAREFLDTATSSSLTSPIVIIAAALPSTNGSDIYIAVHWLASQPMADKVRLRWKQDLEELDLPIDAYWIDRNQEQSVEYLLFDATVYLPPSLANESPLPDDLQLALLKGDEEVSSSVQVDTSRCAEKPLSP